jgi:hypothetical protein
MAGKPTSITPLAVGCSHGESRTQVYRAWLDMMRRCYRPSCKAFRHYGGRGIAVEDSWHNFYNFLRDMGDPPEGLSLERRENNAGYSKGNCVWATRAAQRSNQRVAKITKTKTGIPGVFWHQKHKGFHVYIDRNKQREFLGFTPDFFEACCRRKNREGKKD